MDALQISYLNFAHDFSHVDGHWPAAMITVVSSEDVLLLSFVPYFLIRILLLGKVIPAPLFIFYSVIYSYQYRFMNIYFILWSISSTMFIPFVAQIVPALTIFFKVVRSVPV